jgi:hypothetical protein
MKKDELVSITLDQLTDNLDSTPECFEISCKELNVYTHTTSDVIVWKRKVILDNKSIPDPNGDLRTIIIIYNKTTNELSCHIYLKEVTVQSAPNIKSDASMSMNVGFKWFNRQYRQFQRIKSKIIENERIKENTEYLRKLDSIFPGTFEKDIFGKK